MPAVIIPDKCHAHIKAFAHEYDSKTLSYILLTFVLLSRACLTAEPKLNQAYSKLVRSTAWVAKYVSSCLQENAGHMMIRDW